MLDRVARLAGGDPAGVVSRVTTGMSRPCTKAPLIQLVPGRTAQPNGIADYALALAGALRIRGIDSVFLSGTPADDAAAIHDEWSTVSVPKRQAQSLAGTLESLAMATRASAVLLHFSGYGYQERGAPLWLFHGLRHWSRRAGRVPLLTIFHELYATGWPWRSSFWLSPVQKLIARNILRLTSEGVTPTNVFRDRLLKWNGDARIRCMPVFSNVGEPGCGLPPNARDPEAVIFGLAGVDDRIVGLYRPEIEHFIKTMGIGRILDIGPRSSSMAHALGGVALTRQGALPKEAVSELLHSARFGFIAYPFDVLGKSGVFAAYAAHGVIPVVFATRRLSCDGLEPGRHFLDGLQPETNADADHLAGIQGQLCNWYESHSLPVQAGVIAQTIEERRDLTYGYVGG
jgi:hypothetical protein